MWDWLEGLGSATALQVEGASAVPRQQQGFVLDLTGETVES